jgi:hypothetical protein
MFITHQNEHQFAAALTKIGGLAAQENQQNSGNESNRC